MGEPALVLHFHPGWGATGRAGGPTVIDALVESGAYVSQWVTGTSNGGLAAHPGGDRWAWESRLFAGRYDDSPPGDRPVYGAWNRHGDAYGAAPRFGSAYLRLRPAAVDRATFCWPDSVHRPEAFGGPDRLDELCALADAGGLLTDPLDDYVEAQMHGGVLLSRDVEAVVVDPSDLDAHRRPLGRLPFPVEVHPGYRVSARDIDPGYRGEVPVALAGRLGDEVTPAALSTAQRTGDHDPQALKWLWHCLARFGRLRGDRRDP
ncbi:hypothetical protein F4692_000250 [Nocardioides cavernae]|uniref:DUF3626 domain-containing protein n=1 Tax=Nocardioides cavernae TaxID=1921566 RepID=A0A7Y9H009_9ACTN|nr:DUF3626 domain-containing protein [Nocardioides cavernae]NYE35146.1 hypothetical protein [Nocardioides cavernae]